ncbi:MAG: valine--tRNA ligase [Gemmatimonadota bacterium]|nr:MAG: valine--tRNA ligase [Gemmatimonadota bacterium]
MASVKLPRTAAAEEPFRTKTTVSQTLDPRYDPTGIEAPLYRRWEEAGLFHVPAREVKRPYVISIPPPNVTGALHMGHGLNHTIQDVLIRWRRMQGYDAVWVPGTDHAGIATQNVVERELQEEGLTRWDLGREAFVERVWDWVDQYGGRILEQQRAIGDSCDWERTRFTLDEGLSQAVREVFVRLYSRGLVYRGEYIINWCPRCRTALANEEVEHREEAGKLYHVHYPSADGEPGLVVATTRPETMLGDTAVAVHPDDPRHASRIGRDLLLPLVGRPLPVIADDYVDLEFGTGALKVTPAHDPNDFEIGERHELPRVNILEADGSLSAEAPEAYRGLDRFEARERIVRDLEAEGFLVKVEDHLHAVGHCYRCDTVVEPWLSEQWFVRMKPLAEPGLAAYREGRLRFHPEHFGRKYEHWMENIRDWCISRQLWWGHRIPVWYCEACGSEMVAREEPAECSKCGGDLSQDPDVLDTWFSSALWPFSTVGWPEETPDLGVLYPTDTLVTASEIIFFWVARMVMMGLEFMGELPFTDVVINGTVRDHLGRRMAKSLGNGIDPLEVVQRYGADAMRYTLLNGAAMGTDLQLNYQDLDAAFAVGRNFANKIWNAARFALPYLREEDLVADPEALDRELADRWILSRFRRTTSEMTEALQAYRLHDAAAAVYRFGWGELADWYIELVKARLAGERGERSRDAAAATLAHVLDGWMRLLHPIMPFISEAIAIRLPGRGETDTIVRGPWPQPPASWDDPAAEQAFAALQELVGQVRNLRSEYGIDPGREVKVFVREVPPPLAEALRAEEQGASRLARAAFEEADGLPAEPGAHAVLQSGGELFLPLADLLDLDRELARLAKELDRLDGILAGTRARLDSPAFLDKAPAEVVEREREKARSLEERRERLIEKRRALGEG